MESLHTACLNRPLLIICDALSSSSSVLNAYTAIYRNIIAMKSADNYTMALYVD